MSDTWKQWEGQVVNGQFPLTRYLGGSEHSAVFLTERDERAGVRTAAIKLIPATSENSDLQFSRWRLAGGLSHPHLIKLFEFGKCDVDKVPVLYVVMECAEENLGQVLSSRALTPDETLVMLDPFLEALVYLHSGGFVHGHIKPTNILADGDQLKVSSDTLYRVGDSVDASRTPDAYDPPEKSPGFIPTARTMSTAGDVWSLGMTLMETLTQRLPVAQVGGQGNPPLPQDLPEPFLDIARHCLLPNPASRCTVAEINARLQGNPFPTPRARNVDKPAEPASRKLAEPASRPNRPQAARPKRRRSPVALVVGGGVLVAILIGAFLLRHHPEIQPATAGALETSVAQPAINQQAPPPQATPADAPAQSSDVPLQNGPKGKQDSAGSSPPPAAAAATTSNARGIEPTVKQAPQPPVGGEVVQQVLPDVPQHAKDTIQGTIKIAVKVDVDSSGAVKDAELETPGPSKYFARLAIEAAQRWKFAPSKAAGSSGPGSWTLRFQFTRAGTTVIPSQDTLP